MSGWPIADLIGANILSNARDEIRLNRSTSTLVIIPTAFLAGLNERAEDFGPILLEGSVALQSALQHGSYTVLGFGPPECCSKRSKGVEEPIERRQRDLVDEIFCRNESAPIEGKTALITGGTSGIGLATAKAFVNKGAYVLITGRREAELAEAVKEIGRNVTGIQGDVSNLGDLERLFAQIKREKGRLDIVFANAFAALGAITEELYDWTFDINVKGLLFTVQKALPLLRMALPSS